MGFMDKAKKLAEQAQQKLDEAQDAVQREASRARAAGTGRRRPLRRPRAADLTAGEAQPAGTAPPGRRSAAPAGRARRASAEPPPAAEPAQPGAPTSPLRQPSRRPPQIPLRPPSPPRRRPAEDAARPGRHQRHAGPVQADSVSSLGGILTAMVTPFDADGALNEERRRAPDAPSGRERLGRAGGGRHDRRGPTLTTRRSSACWSSPWTSAATRTVIAGTGSNDTAHSVELTERATEPGVDAVLVVTPYYNKPNRRGLLAHFHAVAARHRPAGDALQHPGALRDQPAERPAARAGARSTTSSRSSRPATEQPRRRSTGLALLRRRRRPAAPTCRDRRARRHLRVLAPGGRARCGG